ncbi:MAG TPA: hypothetical protein VEO54_21850 [Thermoanaerobaculia bacterium]|nr:hypothetical protein [Thermoanaerobaculia bacterium]
MSRRANAATLVVALLLALPAGCMSRIAPHDPTIAAGLADLQTSHARFFDGLQLSTGTPEGAWECHRHWYEETRAAIAVLQVRAASHGRKDDPTAKAIDLLAKSVDELEQAHAEGFSAGEIPVLRTLFDSQLRMLIQLEDAKKRPGIAEVSL